MMSSGINLVMTVIGFAVSTMFIVFVCTRLICARIQLHASRRSFSVGPRSDLSILERGLHGLEPIMVASFPTKKYCDECFSSAENTRCIVCLAEYREEDVLRILPSCGHFFHMTCIDIWLQQHSTCPVCRISLRECPEKKRSMRPLPRSAAQFHQGEGSFATHQYHCTISGHEYSPRIHENREADPNHGDYFPARVDGPEATEICPVHGCSITRDLRNKHLEIPSSS